MGVIGVVLELYKDNGKENGNYCSMIGFNIGYYRGLYKDRKLM